jgi:hypothetical protein
MTILSSAEPNSDNALGVHLAHRTLGGHFGDAGIELRAQQCGRDFPPSARLLRGCISANLRSSIRVSRNLILANPKVR